MKLIKKSVSPIISVVLLILLTTVLIAGFVSWSKASSRDTLNVSEEELKKASNIQCSKYDLTIDSCSIASSQDLNILIMNHTPIDFYHISLTLQGKSMISDQTLKVFGKFKYPIKAGEIKSFKISTDLEYITNDTNVLNNNIIDANNIDIFTIVSSTCPNKVIDLSRCSVKDFSSILHLLSVSKTGTGEGTVTSSPSGINCGGTCSVSYNDGTSVTLTASAQTGSSFTGWTGEGCSGTGTCVVSMTQARNVTANFDEDIFSLSCPTGYVAVEGNPLYNTEYTNGGFCVMKYEAKLLSGTGHNNTSPTCSTGTEDYTSITTQVTSTSSGTPLVEINMCAAKQACVNSGGHLITNDEWMTIVRNIEQVPENWSGGSVGSGYLPRGNSDGSAALDGTDFLTGVNKRTLILTNGEEIWDLAGNVWQWTNNVINYSPPPRYLDNGTEVTDTTNRWYDYSPNGGAGYYIDPNNLGSFPLEKKDLYLLDESYNANNGVGRIYLLGSATTNRGFLRGGYWIRGAYAGVLTLVLSNDLSSRRLSVGFRCVVVP
jgi:hypothetical protein